MKILVTGCSGQLGFDVIKVLQCRSIECYGASRQDFDLLDFPASRQFLEEYKPDVLIHCSAYTAVDKAEDEPELCRMVNAGASRNLAEVCRDIKAKMIYISTDYVFAGEGEDFYETDAPKLPKNVYGQTKLAGELAVQSILPEHFIVRISWVFGINGRNFVKTMLQLGKTHAELTVVKDQIGSPTYTADLAELLADMAMTEKYGVYHATNEGVCSWAEFASEIFRQAQLEVKVMPVGSSAYPTKASRPHNSRMSKQSLKVSGFKCLPVWQDAVGRYLKELQVES
jgi:dTDP-4-dehydrorhamnose reductase